MKTDSSKQSGLSLVEMLAALFLTALAASAGTVLLSQSLQATRMVGETGGEYQRLSGLLAIMREDFAAFVDRPSRPEASSNAPARFEGHPVRADGAIVSFVRNGWANPDEGSPRGDLQRLEYHLEQGRLIRRSWGAPDAGPATRVSDQTLITQLERIEVRYGSGSGWQDQWTAILTQDPLPDKIEFVFVFSEADKLTARFRLAGQP